MADRRVKSVISGRQQKRSEGLAIPKPRLVYTQVWRTRYRPMGYLRPRMGSISGPMPGKRI